MSRRWLIAVLIAAAAVPVLIHAQGAVVVPAPRTITFEPEVPLPGFIGGPISSSTFIQYLRAVFVYFMGVVGILGVVMVIWGGIKWVAAAGNPGKINDARDQVNSAIIGIIIALTSVLLLTLINPRLTSFEGLTLKQLDPKLLSFTNEITSVTVPFDACGVSEIFGEPSKACYNEAAPICSGDLDSWITDAAKTYTVDPILVKAIMTQESLKNGFPLSRPTNVFDNPPHRLTSAYGLGQFVVGTMIPLLREVNGGLPQDCPASNNVDPATNTLIPKCQAWLDTHLETQVKMMARYLNQVGSAGCVNHDLRLMTIAYFLGPGNAQKYCAGSTDQRIQLSGMSAAQIEQTKNQAVTYVALTYHYYTTYCSASKTVITGHAAPR